MTELPKEVASSLASRGQRFIAALIDSAVLFAPTFILALIFPQKGTAESVLETMGIMGALDGLYILVVLLTQAIFLSISGQTIGKKIEKIKIVRKRDGQNGGFITNVLLRALVNGLIGLIPLYGLVDALFIFGTEQRCLHDRIAGTIVVAVALKS